MGKGTDVILLIRGLSVTYLAVAAAGTTIAIADELPANFANWDLASDSVTRDFLIGGGTALSAPLALLVVFAGLLLLCGRSDRIGRIALVALVVVSIGFVVGMAGEPVTREVLDSPGEHIDRAIVVIAAIALAVAIAAAAETAIQLHGTRES
jgi:hypothetical protein